MLAEEGGGGPSRPLSFFLLTDSACEEGDGDDGPKMFAGGGKTSRPLSSFWPTALAKRGDGDDRPKMSTGGGGGGGN